MVSVCVVHTVRFDKNDMQPPLQHHTNDFTALQFPVCCLFISFHGSCYLFLLARHFPFSLEYQRAEILQELPFQISLLALVRSFLCAWLEASF